MNSYKIQSYFIILLFVLISCESEQSKKVQKVESTNQEINFSNEQTSYTQVGELEDVSYANVKRISARITIPLRRTTSEVTETLKRAAIEIENRTGADAVMILAYRPSDDFYSSFTVGRAIFAPKGKWGEADYTAPKDISIDLNDLYFKSAKPTFPIDTLVKLIDMENNYVDISREYGSWVDEDIIVKIPSGQEVTIIEMRSQPMGDQEFVRYKVRVLSDNKEWTGWVHESEVTSLN